MFHEQMMKALGNWEVATPKGGYKQVNLINFEYQSQGIKKYGYLMLLAIILAPSSPMPRKR